MNPATGTFITMDEYAGSVFEPVSLHKYLYANANPVNNSDPSGYFTQVDNQMAMTGAAEVSKSASMAGFKAGMRILSKLLSPSFIIANTVLLPVIVTLANIGSDLLSGIETSASICNDVKDKAKDDADEATLPKNRRNNDGCTYYHATSKATAGILMLSQVFGVTVLKGSSWEGGRVFVWKYKPDKKALKLSGALGTEVIIAFESNAHFENDPAFSVASDQYLSQKDLAHINKFQPLRSCFPGPIIVTNVRIVG